MVRKSGATPPEPFSEWKLSRWVFSRRPRPGGPLSLAALGLLLGTVAVACGVGLFSCAAEPSSGGAATRSNDELSTTESPPPATDDDPKAEPPELSESRAELTTLLLEGRFAELDERVDRAAREAREDYRLEANAELVWNTFRVPDADVGDALERWVAALPDSAVANAAYGGYLCQRAWDERGSAFANETSKDQWVGLHKYFRLADPYLDRALRLDPDLIEPRLELHWIQMATRMGPPKAKMERELLEVAPASYRVRSQLATARLPRWGGSLAELSAFAEETSTYTDENPRLRVFAGWPDWAAGRIRSDADEHREALRHFDRALELGGEFALALEGRGRARSALKNYAGARADLERAVELRPGSVELLTLASRFQARTNDFDTALETLAEADAIGVDSEWVESASSYITQRIGERIQELGKERSEGWRGRAEELVAHLEERAPDTPWTAYRRAQIDVYEPNLPAAEAQLVECTERYPDFYNCYVTLDWVLAKERSWDEIVRHWDRFLAHSPEHAEGYYQRAGAQKRRPNMRAAMEDLSRACELGHRASCGILKRSQRSPRQQPKTTPAS